jgi:hypothetical protein
MLRPTDMASASIKRAAPARGSKGMKTLAADMGGEGFAR